MESEVLLSVGQSIVHFCASSLVGSAVHFDNNFEHALRYGVSFDEALHLCGHGAAHVVRNGDAQHVRRIALDQRAEKLLALRGKSAKLSEKLRLLGCTRQLIVRM